jgi:predicted NBD/HSP70 family sugar kinase
MTAPPPTPSPAPATAPSSDLATAPVPATPRLMRAINERAALETLLERGPLSRPELGTLTGLSGPTASQLLGRLRRAGLVIRDGRREGSPGRTADLYRINPDAAYVCGLDVTPHGIEAAVGGLTGPVIGRFRLPARQSPANRADLLRRVRAAVAGACRLAGLDPAELDRVVIGVQGAVDPRSGRLRYAGHLRGWHVPDLTGTLRSGLGVPVHLENDVNLVAVAERIDGAARGHDDVVLLWGGPGMGVALMFGGRLHRGATGCAGEVGHLPVPGAPTAREVSRRAGHGLQALAGGAAVRAVLRGHGFRAATAAAAVRAAARAWTDGDDRAEPALRAVAGRVATGLAVITALIDPEVVVLTGEVLLAGGEPLRGLIDDELGPFTVPRPPLRLSALRGNPVLAGALAHARCLTREELFGSTART